MIGSTHIAMTKAVVEALKWKGDLNLVARNAVYPDDVRAIEVETYGAHVIGKNLASLVHFCRPIGEGKHEGYCWKLDRSVPHIDLSKVKVIARPEQWGYPLTREMWEQDPFAVLVKDLTGHGSLEADQITYSTAAVMVQWLLDCYKELAKTLTGEERQKALDTIAGWIFHLAAQDPVVPHHAVNVLLDGHSAFESDVDEEFKRLVGDGTIAKLLETLVKTDNLPTTGTLREFVEQTADKSVVSVRKLGWYRCFWRRGWNQLVRTCVLRGLTTSVQTGKLLLKAAE